uniref:Putative secreted protein n=1 Tax=Anopheles marajoara TaxID=58244 RepID=A0A2M4C6B3_9DIPT
MVIARPCILWFFRLCIHLNASWRLFMTINAHPRGGIMSMLTMSPYLPNVSDSSSCWTSFDRWPTHKVVLQTLKCSFLISGNPFRFLSRSCSFSRSRSLFEVPRSREERRRDDLGERDVDRERECDRDERPRLRPLLVPPRRSRGERDRLLRRDEDEDDL